MHISLVKSDLYFLESSTMSCPTMLISYCVNLANIDLHFPQITYCVWFGVLGNPKRSLYKTWEVDRK